MDQNTFAVRITDLLAGFKRYEQESTRKEDRREGKGWKSVRNGTGRMEDKESHAAMPSAAM